MMSRVSFKALIIGMLLSWLVASPVRAADVEAHVTYVAWKTLYLDIGRAQGVENGLRGLLYREMNLIGEISIAATADSTCVATLEGDSVIAALGDRALVLLAEHGDDSGKATTVTEATLPDPAEQRKQSKPTKHVRRTARFSGRFALQFDGYDDQRDSRSAELLPGLSTRMVMHRIAGESSDFSLKYRGRKLNNSADKLWQHRLYTAALSFAPQHERWTASVGRIQAGSVAGIGYIDGGYGEVALGRGLAVGMFGGAEAVLDVSQSDILTSKAGGLLTYESVRSAGARTTATLALAGEYLEGNISREFIYQQLTHSTGGGFSVYESADFNINRGWKQELDGGFLTPANFLLNVRYTPLRSLALSGGYDGHSRYRTWETRETPDSLFEDALRHGFRAGAELTMLRGTKLSAQQSLRSNPNSETLYPSGTYMLSSNTLWNGCVGAALRFSRFENYYTTGDQQAVSLTLSPYAGLDLRSEYGETSYSYRQSNTTSSSQWFRLSTDVSLRSGAYCSVQAERTLAEGTDAVRAFVEFGYRIR